MSLKRAQTSLSCTPRTRIGQRWFVSLNHARAVIRAWVRGYNEERPKKTFGGLTPAAYTRQLATTAVSSIHGLY